ncbi:MAG: hypothetical protein CL734_06515 [Chloroflexi bacterium]|nr:hypothetical protein [Chloroflexota bacterium]
MAILGASQLQLHYADLEVFSNVTLQVDEKDRIGLVGPNGSGKTSLIKVLLDLQDYDSGEVFKKDNLRIGYVPQTVLETGKGTIDQQIMSAFSEIIKTESQMQNSALEIEKATGQKRSDAEKMYSSLLEKYESIGGYDYINRKDKVVEGVGLSQEVLKTNITDASGGERTRTALATALLNEPDLLILDEPTNYLDFKGLEWLEDFLIKSQNAFIVISHDRFFLDRVAESIWDIDQKQLKTYKGNYSKFKLIKEENETRLLKEYEKQQEYIKREENFIARYHAGQRSKEARGRAKKLSRIEKINAPENQRSVSIRPTSASRTGQVVISTHGLVVGHTIEGKNIELFNVPDLEIQKNTTTAIIGNNGIGKTTFLKTLLGEIPALNGFSELGYNVQTGYFRQGSDEIPNDISVLDALLEIKNITIGEARSFLARFLFSGDEIFDQVRSLSGGEKGRLALARLLLKEPNVLILDEPTTHLDIESREALELMLQDFEGTVIFVSHDRHLISFLADSLLIIQNQTVVHFKGSYEDWVKENTSVKFKNKDANRPIKLDSRKKSKNKTPKKSEAKESEILESKIKDIESEIELIESQLSKASNSGNIDEIYELGEKHNQLNKELEDALTRWGNA